VGESVVQKFTKNWQEKHMETAEAVCCQARFSFCHPTIGVKAPRAMSVMEMSWTFQRTTTKYTTRQYQHGTVKKRINAVVFKFVTHNGTACTNDDHINAP